MQLIEISEFDNIVLLLARVVHFYHQSAPVG